MPVPGSNRGMSAWQYIRPLSLMQYGGGRYIADLREPREDKTLQKAAGLKSIQSDSGRGERSMSIFRSLHNFFICHRLT